MARSVPATGVILLTTLLVCLSQRLAGVRQLERTVVDGSGHFIHMEKPDETAALILDYVRRQP